MAERMLHELSIRAAELSVLMTDDATIRSLNRDFRGRDTPTDVLAFPQEDRDPCDRFHPDTRLLGDVVISVDTAQRQARDLGHVLQQEVCWLLAHGLLHLLGYDHATRPERRRMDEMTARLVDAAGHGAAGAALPGIGQRARRHR
jgi:probable rRNA maturation factor